MSSLQNILENVDTSGSGIFYHTILEIGYVFHNLLAIALNEEESRL